MRERDRRMRGGAKVAGCETACVCPVETVCACSRPPHSHTITPYPTTLCALNLQAYAGFSYSCMGGDVVVLDLDELGHVLLVLLVNVLLVVLCSCACAPPCPRLAGTCGCRTCACATASTCACATASPPLRDLSAILLHAVGELRHLYCQRLPVSVSNTVLQQGVRAG